MEKCMVKYLYGIGVAMEFLTLLMVDDSRGSAWPQEGIIIGLNPTDAKQKVKELNEGRGVDVERYVLLNFGQFVD